MEPVEGIYPDVPEQDYNEIAALRHTILKAYGRSSAHGHQEELHPKEPTDALIEGRAIHCATIEPEKFAKRYAQAPYQNRSTKKEKEAWKALEAEQPHAEILRKNTYEQILAVALAVRTNPIAAKLFSAGAGEVVAVWKQPATEVYGKLRLDWITAVDGRTVVVDLKSTEDARPWSFSKSCHDYGYHTQAAWYLDGLFQLDAREREFWLVAVEKKPPFANTVYQLDPNAIQLGREENARRLERFTDAKVRGLWPGYDPGPEFIGLPEYAYREDDR